ncbi:MAG: SDR family oxidoreductase [Rhodospirillaceae bacterium]|jgi:enoyl-[acyl-carrier protein] reductase III|nr:SDR family oxidoreductase [Rhodospirillaceae bacterium]MBT5677198.1 SDR family oxidoreductase [Rhodospirillaceae bacterium]
MAILVTGGSKGIGLQIALSFSEPGNQVFLNYASDDQAAALAQQAVQALGAECHLLKGDAGTPEGCKRIMHTVAENVEQLDQLVHCAVRAVPHPALECDLVEFTNAVNLNGTALLYLTQAAMPLLKRGSTIFFLSSRGSRIVVPNYAAIGVAKSLGECLVRYLAAELAPHGIRINTVSPGVVDTEAVRTLFGDDADEIVRHAAENNPSGRGVEHADYTNMIRFLASPEAEFVQGQTIFINGGANLMA